MTGNVIQNDIDDKLVKYKEKGKKIEDEYENPIDIILIKISYELSPLFFKLKLTPNMITTLSLLFTLIGINYIYNGSYKIGSIFYFIGYFFDCMDGNYARRYQMVSEFGDYYDHIGDTIKILFLLMCLYLIKIKKIIKIYFIIIMIVFGILTLGHMGCQEKQKNEKDKSVLEIFKKLCSNSDNIIYTKYFGCGTSQLIISLFIFNIKFIEKIFK